MDLSKLDKVETELLNKAPLLVCILIAGADGKIDNREFSEAISLSKQQDWVKSVLRTFFQEVSTDFEDKLKILIQSYPSDTEARNQSITMELRKLNDLWLRLDREFAEAYYEMLGFFAHRIAASSGSFWGKISSEEETFLRLPMLNDPRKK
jgi:hypothetical protein